MDRRKRVLVLDFDDELLINLERTLEDSGFSATATWDVQQACALMESKPFDFFIVGNRPPRLDAYQLLAYLRGQGLRFGSFVLGNLRADDYGNLLDQIASFPCASSQETKATVLEDATKSLTAVSHGQ